ncbi:RnfH family protein, partial [Acinetobacter baumannii]|nr:RnfH family protein [Acinetobacter baumannii]
VKVETDAVLHAGDRVEVYRPLTINPKDIRRKRAAKNPVGRYIKGNRFKQSAQ